MRPFKLFFFGLIIFASCTTENQAQNDHIFSEGPVVVKGQIRNAESETVLLTNLELTGSVDNIAKLDSLGNFEINFNILSPHDNFLIHNGHNLQIFAEPNDTILISADGSDFEKTISYSGSNASFNQSLKLFFIEFRKLLKTKDFLQKRENCRQMNLKNLHQNFLI